MVIAQHNNSSNEKSGAENNQNLILKKGSNSSASSEEKPYSCNNGSGDTFETVRIETAPSHDFAFYEWDFKDDGLSNNNKNEAADTSAVKDLPHSIPKNFGSTDTISTSLFGSLENGSTQTGYCSSTLEGLMGKSMYMSMLSKDLDAEETVALDSEIFGGIPRDSEFAKTTPPSAYRRYRSRQSSFDRSSSSTPQRSAFVRRSDQSAALTTSAASASAITARDLHPFFDERKNRRSYTADASILHTRSNLNKETAETPSIITRGGEGERSHTVFRLLSKLSMKIRK